MTRLKPVLAVLSLLVLAGWGGNAFGQGAHKREHAAPNAKVFFIGLADGATVPSQLTVKFGAENIEIVPASVDKPNSGHFHILIDSPMPAVDAPIPNDANHLHFGKGQTEGEIILPAGEHTLQLLLGDHAHVPHDPPVASPVIHVRVDPATIEKPRTPAPADAKVFFVGLDDGAKIPTKSTVKFGVSGIEVVPAGAQKPNSGHHHLLIDAPLPPLDREIPNDANHLHFGKGQTEAEISLTPGPHTLQLLFGDYEHVPHEPPVMSKPIHVVAVEGGAAPAAEAAPGRTPSPPDAAVYFVYPHNGERIYPSSTIRFGLKNMGVAPAGVQKPNTGHHHLLIDADPISALDQPIPNDPNHLHFGGGQTEKKINLPVGKHTLQLVLGDYKHIPFDPPVMSQRIEVIVTRQMRRRRH
jgi:hypothetical protein